MIDAQEWTHDRAHIRRLHHAHADHIESMYRGMLALPGNPEKVIIQRIDSVRTFIARGDRLENRAIFDGDEPFELVDRVLEHYASHRSNCVIEVNPSNFHVKPPATWEMRLLKHLLARGFYIDGFRCVWYYGGESLQGGYQPRHRWEQFETDRIREYFELAQQVEGKFEVNEATIAAVSQPGWRHYVGFERDQPCAVTKLFVNGSTAYLAWMFTHPAHRGRGFQADAIRLRLGDAFAAGCDCAFTVTDINIPSARNIQRHEFKLAYNYLMIRYQPPTIYSAK